MVGVVPELKRTHFRRKDLVRFSVVAVVWMPWTEVVENLWCSPEGLLETLD